MKEFMGVRNLFILLLLLFAANGEIFAQGMYVFPRNGQTMEQQSSDTGNCRQWAMRETGVDPAYVQGQLAMMQNQMGGQNPDMPVVRSGLRNAGMGAMLGGIHNNMDPGAGRGATMGVAYGAVKGVEQRREMQKQAEAQQAQAQMQRVQASADSYARAYSVCMDAKGYSVK